LPEPIQQYGERYWRRKRVVGAQLRINPNRESTPARIPRPRSNLAMPYSLGVQLALQWSGDEGDMSAARPVSSCMCIVTVWAPNNGRSAPRSPKCHIRACLSASAGV
jgi:hypothetical protein